MKVELSTNLNVNKNLYSNKGATTSMPKIAMTQKADEVAFTGIAGMSSKGKKILKSVSKQNYSPLELERLVYKPAMPKVFKNNGIKNIKVVEGAKTESVADQEAIKELFPNTYGQPVLTFKNSAFRKILGNLGLNKSEPTKVGVILSGGQAAGGHNVIVGLYDALKSINKKNEIYGFLNGPKGLIDGDIIKLDDKTINSFRNQGGFDMIGSGRDKIETEAHIDSALANCKKYSIKHIIGIGGDDTNSNNQNLAEAFIKKAREEKITVNGCPKTIDGDLKNAHIEASFGFDTATKTYAETVGNLQRDAISAKKYWFFQKVMGRSASHVALEVAHKTHPNITLISEEVAQKNMKLDDVVSYMADIIAQRANNGKNYGVAVIPEGLVEFVPDVKLMIKELDKVLPKFETDLVYGMADNGGKIALVEKTLSEENGKLYASLPVNIKKQLITEKRDSHGNFPVSQLETDKLLIDMVKTKLAKMKDTGEFGGKFSAIAGDSGYDGRSCLPSNFDSDYCNALGYSAAALVNSGRTGYMATVNNLAKSADKWEAGGTPLSMMMNMEERKGKMVPVIQKALVDIDGPVFKEFEKNRGLWAKEDKYVNPGPIQFHGPKRLTDMKTNTLMLEQAAKK